MFLALVDRCLGGKIVDNDAVFIHNLCIGGVSMEREEFLTKFQELSVEYRNLKKRLDETDKKDQSLRLEIMQQMQDNVRRKNALRKHFTIEEN